MNLLFDSAGLAVVAYAEVLGQSPSAPAAGTSPNSNSGVTTTRVGVGLYDVILPASKAQSAATELLIVTPEPPYPFTGQQYSAAVANDPTNSQIKHVAVYANQALTDNFVSFDILILRTVISPPAGSPD